MGGSCSLHAKVLDKKTNKLTSEDSWLHHQLLRLKDVCPSFTRRRANNLICKAQSTVFQETFKDDILFDKNQEPTIASLWEVTHDTDMHDVTLGQMRDFLGKEFKEGVCPNYEDAYKKAIDFNKNYEGSKTYIGVVEYDNQAKKFSFRVVYNSQENQKAFTELIAKVHMYKTIEQKLHSLGIGIQTIEDGSKYSGFFNTKNFEEIEHGLQGIIGVTNPEAFNLETLSKETGHFIMEALPDNPLVIRLKELVRKNPEVVGKIIGDIEYNNITFELQYSTQDKVVDELTGHLVGAYLCRSAKEMSALERTPFKTLLNRIKHYISVKFSWATRHYFDTTNKIAEQTAEKLAKEFLGNNFKGTLNSALSGEKKILHDTPKGMAALTGNIIKKLQELHAKQKHIGEYDTAKQLKTTLGNLTAAYLNMRNENASDNVTNLRTLNEAVQALTKQASTIVNRLSINYQGLCSATGVVNLELNRSDWAPICQAILQYQTLKNGILEITDIRNNRDLQQIADILATMQTSGVDDETKAEAKSQYIQLINTLQDLRVVFQMDSTVATLEDAVVYSFCKTINGCDAFYVPQHRTLNRGYVHEKVVTLEDYLTGNTMSPTDNVPNSFQSLIFSMGSSNDVINQIMHTGVNMAKRTAVRRSAEFAARMDAIFGDYQAKSIRYAMTHPGYIARDTSRLLAKFADNITYTKIDGSTNTKTTKNTYTGFFKDRVNWGKWHEDKRAFVAERANEFVRNNCTKYNPNGKYTSEIAARSSEEYRKIKKDAEKLFHKSHSVKVPVLDAKGNPIIDSLLGTPKTEWQPYDSKYIYLANVEVGNKTTDYHDSDYDNLAQFEKDALKKLTELKAEIDTYLPPSIRDKHKAPQFRTGTLRAAFNNMRKGSFNGTKHSFDTVALRAKALTSLVNASEVDTEYYGSDYSEEEENLYGNGQRQVLHNIRRVPLYGTKTLRDLSNIETDVFGSMVSFADMAYSFDAMHEVGLTGEVAMAQYDHRKMGDGVTTIETFDSKNSKKGQRVSNQLNDFLEREIFNVKSIQKAQNYDSKFATQVKILCAKFVAQSGVGFLLDEAMQMINAVIPGRNTVLDANNSIAAGKGKGMHAYQFVGGRVNNITKLSLFMKFFNVGGAQSYRNYQYAQMGTTFCSILSLDNLLMAPYTLTDHFLQGAAYLAAAHHIKVTRVSKTEKDKNGKPKEKQVKLWDIFDANSNILNLKDTDKYEYYIVDQNHLNVIRYRNKQFGATQIPETDARIPLLLEKDITKKRDEELEAARSLQTAIQSGTANVFSSQGPTEEEIESKYAGLGRGINFNDRAFNLIEIQIRGVNNRMHGVYNNMDQGTGANAQLWFPVLTALKKYAIGLIEKRFNSGHYSSEEQDYIQGSYITALSLITSIMFHYSHHRIDQDNTGFTGAMKEIGMRLEVVAGTMLGIIPFLPASNIMFRNMCESTFRKMGYSHNQIANLSSIRNDFKCMLVMNILASMCLPPPPPDKTDEEIEELTPSALLKYAQSLGIKTETGTISEIMQRDDMYFINLAETVREKVAARKNASEEESTLFDSDILGGIALAYGFGLMNDTNPAKIKKSSRDSLLGDKDLYNKTADIYKDIIRLITLTDPNEHTDVGMNITNNSIIDMWKTIYLKTGLLKKDDYYEGVIQGNFGNGGYYKIDPKNEDATPQQRVSETPFNPVAGAYLMFYRATSEQAAEGAPLLLDAARVLYSAISPNTEDSTMANYQDDSNLQLLGMGDNVGLSQLVPNTALITTAFRMKQALDAEPDEYNSAGMIGNDPNAPTTYYTQKGNYAGVAKWRIMTARLTPYLRSAIQLQFAYAAAQGNQHSKLVNIGINH